jgi:four helix bundle protein
MSKLKSVTKNPKTGLKLRSFIFSIKLIRFCQNLPRKREFALINDQLIRSSTSIGANIVEAKSSSPRRDFIKFYEIALKSANESRYWLCLLREIEKELAGKTSEILSELEEISKMIGASIITMKGRRF